MDKIIAKSISNIYNTAKQRISSNLQWAGQQAQQNIGRPVQQTIQNVGNRVSSNLNLVAKPIQNQVKRDMGQLSYYQQQEKQNKLQPSTMLSATTPVGQIGRALRTDYDTQINKVLSGNFTSNPTLNRVTSNIGLVAKPVINTALDFVAPKFSTEESTLIKKINTRQKLTPQEARLTDSMATRNTLNIGLSMSGVKSIDKPAIKLLDPLLTEAKKYKSAEEFVKAQGEPVYHGGSKARSALDITKAGSKESNKAAKEGFWFAKDMNTAKGYGNKVLEAFPGMKNPKVIDAEGKMFGDMRDVIDEIVPKAKQDGFDGVIIKNLSDEKNWGQYNPTDHYVVFDPSNIKTKSQLTDIWNKANTDPVKRINVLKQPRSEKVAQEMLKKGTIDTPKYNEIAGREGFRAQPTLKEQQSTKELENLLGDNSNASITNRLREEVSQSRQKEIVRAQSQITDSNSLNAKIPIRTKDQILGESLPQQTQSQVKVANMNTESLSKKLEVARYKRAQGAETSQINLPSMEDIVSAPGNNVKNKVNALDYLRTPDRVLQKIGLGKQAETIRQSYNNYLDELPKEINKVTQWYERVGKSKESSQRIFQYLDGKPVTLIGEEVPVANEIKQYLKKWADKLNLPDDKRIASYITHIFEKDFIQKEFDPDLAKIIQDKVPGSVYDPFLQERLGKQGYIEDAFRALDAYVKRATRKFHMDPALEKLSSASENLDIDSWNYVKQYADRLNLRPTTWDNLLDNLVKSTPVGYKLGQRPVANVTRKLRQQVYRGTLGLNVGSAIRNLTQGVNTYAQLGEKYTAIGYLKAIKAMMTGSQELENAGVLRNSFIEDRGISATKKLWEKIDKGLFTFFEMAEKINRGSAYYGAKSKALAQGMSEQDAVKAGLDLARKTQFTFGSVDTPVALQSDIIKFATQFQSFNIKQTEFLAEMFKSKQYSGLIRWLGANAVILLTLGKVMGWDWKDMVPFGGVLEGQTPIGGSPVFTLGRDIGALSTGGKDKYGQDMKPGQIATDLIPLIPGGVQVLNKTIPGVYDVNQGYATSGYGFEKLSDIATGNKRRIKYPIEKTPQNYIQAALLGGSNLPEARQYKESNSSVLGEKQSQSVRDSADKIGTYNKIMTKRATDK